MARQGQYLGKARRGPARPGKARQGNQVKVSEMIKARVYLKSESPYSQSKVITADKLPRETHDDYEKRTWRERTHTTKDGHVFIPAQAFSSAIKEAAKFLNMQIPGQGKATYTKNFLSAVAVMTPLVLPDIAAEVPGETLHVPSDGKPGGAKRVWKTFPRIDEWEGWIEFYIYDDIITREVFDRAINAAGLLIGIGRYRPRNGGMYGRFSVREVIWEPFNV